MAWLSTDQIQQIEESTPTSNYIKLNKLPENKEHRYRAFGEPITGYLGWTEPDTTSPYGKPIRWELKPKTLPETLQKDEKTGQPRVQFFVSGLFWDYTNNLFGIIEITQRMIFDRLKALECDEDYGDLKTFDIKITRKIQSEFTKYEVMPSPPKPVNKELEAAYNDFYCDLNALYRGEDPFKDPAKT